VSFSETGGKRPKARGAWESAMEKVGDRIVLRVEFRRRLIPCKIIWGTRYPSKGLGVSLYTQMRLQITQDYMQI
jgi:hypothetical protein